MPSNIPFLRALAFKVLNVFLLIHEVIRDLEAEAGSPFLFVLNLDEAARRGRSDRSCCIQTVSLIDPCQLFTIHTLIHQSLVQVILDPHMNSIFLVFT